jgi:hypothetical protein
MRPKGKKMKQIQKTENAFECSGSSPGLSQAEILYPRLTRKRQDPASDGPETARNHFEAQPVVDFSLEYHGQIFLLRPLTPAAFDWVEQHIGRDNGFQSYWPNVVIEHRYVEGVVDGIQADGLEVS